MRGELFARCMYCRLPMDFGSEHVCPAKPEVCTDCGNTLFIGSHPFCPDHTRAQPHRPFSGFTFTDDRGTTHTIDSIQAANKIEKESMRRYRNGEGQPFSFRMFHQDNSNRDRNTFDALGHKQQLPQKTTRRGQPIRKSYGRGE